MIDYGLPKFGFVLRTTVHANELWSEDVEIVVGLLLFEGRGDTPFFLNVVDHDLDGLCGASNAVVFWFFHALGVNCFVDESVDNECVNCFLFPAFLLLEVVFCHDSHMRGISCCCG